MKENWLAGLLGITCMGNAYIFARGASLLVDTCNFCIIATNRLPQKEFFVVELD